uniref:ELMO domain-containing protein n=1 Tax=Neospora caninum (strain Liverpool) TaxID=572307 RepID=A0A0F7UEE3_NEOCL|nr:TPA: hypothetical protein BN1204_028200 [Neospora caninum Liverpool]
MGFFSVFASLRAFVHRLYRAALNVVISLITGMSQLERLLNRYPCFPRGLKPALPDKTSRSDPNPDGPACQLAAARQAVAVEELLRTRSSSTGIAASLYSSAVPVEDLCQLICAECTVRSLAHRGRLVDILRRIRRKQEATNSVKSRARQHFEPNCAKNHRRLERMWRLFFDKPLPPSFHCCSSLVGKRPSRTPQLLGTTSSLLTSPNSNSLSSSSSICLSPDSENSTSAALCSDSSSAAGAASFAQEAENSMSLAGSTGPARDARPRQVANLPRARHPAEQDEERLLTGSREAGPFELQESSWGELGFQHPLHDFRGAGCLGADCLLFLGQRFPAVAQRLLQESRDEQFWMPFAATSINVVGWLLEMMDRRLLDVFLFACDESSFSEDSSFEKMPSDFHNFSKQSDAIVSSEDNAQDAEQSDNDDCSAVPAVFLLLYAAVFAKFCQFWRSRQPENILQFGKVSMDFRERLEKAFKEFASGREGGNMGAWEYILESGAPQKGDEVYRTSTEVLDDITACIEDRLHVTENGKQPVQSSPPRQEGTVPAGTIRKTEKFRLLRLVNAHMDT